MSATFNQQVRDAIAQMSEEEFFALKEALAPTQSSVPEFNGTFDFTPFAKHIHESFKQRSRVASRWSQPISHNEKIPDLAQLEKDRAELVRAERANLQWDCQARAVVGHIPAVIKANELLSGAKNATRKLEYTNQPGEVLPQQGDYEMGHVGTGSRATTEGTMVAKLLKGLHKGGELHLHTNTLGDPIEYFKYNLETLPNTNYIRFTKPLMGDNWRDVEAGFEIWEEGTPEFDPFAADYKSPREEFKYPTEDGTIVPLKKFTNGMLFTNFVACFHEHYSKVAHRIPGSKKYMGEDGKYCALLWVKDRIIITEEDRVAADCGCNYLWAKFNMGTRCWKNVVGNGTTFRKYMLDFYRTIIEHGRGHCEHRFIATEAGVMNGDGKSVLSVSGQIKLMLETWKEFDATRVKGSPEWELLPYMPKIVFCAPRGIPVVPVGTQTDADYELNIDAKCRQCVRLLGEFPDAISAFDLVGAEDRGQPTRNFLKQLIWFRNKCVDLGYDVPFLFHCGESNIDLLGTLDQENSGCYDFILLNVVRAGHGLSLLTKYPFHVEILRQRNSRGARHAIEINLTSNILLGAYANANHHPLDLVINSGLPWNLNVDNGLNFDTDGHLEYLRAFLGCARLDLIGLYQTVLWSYQCSILAKDEIQERCEWATKNFISYCEDITREENVRAVLDHYTRLHVQRDPKHDATNAEKYIRQAFPMLSAAFL